MTIKLIVGLGNPGAEYDKTRHNAGAWFVEVLATAEQLTLRAEKKFLGLYGQAKSATDKFHLLLPTTFMNHSGQAVLALAQFYKIAPQHILVVHDELDLPAGMARLKQGGGHGGHNGLRDIIRHLGTNDFIRLRLGIGHPGDKNRVLDYVLGRPSVSDNKQIHQAIGDAISILPQLSQGDLQKAMHALHSE